MTQHDHHTRHAGASPSRQARIRLVADGVVASYIHDISARRAHAPVVKRRRGSQGALRRTTDFVSV